MSNIKVPKKIEMKSPSEYEVGEVIDVCGNKLQVVEKKVWRAPVSNGKKSAIYKYTLIDKKYMKKLEAQRGE